MREKHLIKSSLILSLIIFIALAVINILALHVKIDTIIVSFVFSILIIAIFYLLFALSPHVIPSFKQKQQCIIIDKHIDEDILFEGFASHFTNIAMIAGKIYLTNKRIVFSASNTNNSAFYLSINLNDINNINSFKMSCIINKGTEIYLKDQTSERFLLDNSVEFLDSLNTELSLASLLI